MESQYYLPDMTGFSLFSSPDFPFTPGSSPQSAQNQSWSCDLKDLYHNNLYWIDGKCQSSAFMSGAIGSDTGGLPHHTAVHQEYAYMDYQPISNTSTGDNSPISALNLPSTPGKCISYFDMSPAGSFMMPSPQSLSPSGSIVSMSSWSCSNENLAAMAFETGVSDAPSSLDTDHHPLGPYSLRDSESTCQMESLRKMNNPEETTISLQQQTPRLSEGKAGSLSIQAKVIPKSLGECDYPGCNKAFRRAEHLKRHKQAHHGEGKNRFFCEFCGKDNFNRHDNLQTHRRLHARQNKRHRSIKFVPAAVSIIEEEDRIRGRRGSFLPRGMKA